MDKELEKKRFKHPRDYVGIIIFWAIVIAFSFTLTAYFTVLSEESIREQYATPELYGNSKIRFAQSLKSFLVKTFGKKGLIGLLLALSLLFFFELYSEISEYHRYKHKCKLYQEGVIKNFFDIYDDTPSFSVFRWIRNIFRKKKSKYPSKKELKKSEKEMEEYFKNKV